MQAATKSSDRKEIAISFLKEAASGNVDEAYRKVSSNFRHHNAYFPGDTESLKQGMAEAHKKFPATKLEVQNALEDGDLVAIHSRVSHGPNEPDITVVHLFRFERDQIIELWDIGMEAPKEMPNENGLF
jgi:predicted SnoaL-like aldol condensation-catalyzing enzyme